MTNTAPEEFGEPVIIWHDDLQAAIDAAPKPCAKCHAPLALMIYSPNDLDFSPSHTNECPSSGIGRQIRRTQTGRRLRVIATEPE
jgi:hypothetical protein